MVSKTLVHTAPGAGLFPYLVEDSLVGFLEQSSKFLKPVYSGDTIYPALEVIETRPRPFDRRGDVALDGSQPAQGTGVGGYAEISGAAAAGAVGATVRRSKRPRLSQAGSMV